MGNLVIVTYIFDKFTASNIFLNTRDFRKLFLQKGTGEYHLKYLGNFYDKNPKSFFLKKLN